MEMHKVAEAYGVGTSYDVFMTPEDTDEGMWVVRVGSGPHYFWLDADGEDAGGPVCMGFRHAMDMIGRLIEQELEANQS